MKENIICKIFGHNWKYFFINYEGPNQEIRFCKRCCLSAHFKRVPGTKKDWVWMLNTGYTKYGAKKLLEEIKTRNINLV